MVTSMFLLPQNKSRFPTHLHDISWIISIGKDELSSIPESQSVGTHNHYPYYSCAQSVSKASFYSNLSRTIQSTIVSEMQSNYDNLQWCVKILAMILLYILPQKKNELTISLFVKRILFSNLKIDHRLIFSTSGLLDIGKTTPSLLSSVRPFF